MNDDDGVDLTTPEMDHLYTAWTVIANAGHNRGGWEAEDPEWVAAAIRWRDRFHELIGVPAATTD